MTFPSASTRKNGVARREAKSRARIWMRLRWVGGLTMGGILARTSRAEAPVLRIEERCLDHHGRPALAEDLDLESRARRGELERQVREGDRRADDVPAV